MLLHAQTTSKSIRHPKLHDIRYKNCSDWTIFRDFRHPEVQVKYDENRDSLIFYFELKNKTHIVLPHAQTTSQSIRHPKLHDIMCKNCPDWTILRDFRLSEVQVKYDVNRGNRDALLFYFELKNRTHILLPHAQTTYQSLRHPKLHDNRCKNCPGWTILRNFSADFFQN